MECREREPDAIGIRRIDDDPSIVARALVDAALSRPARAAIERAEDAAFAILDHGVDDAWIARGDRQPYPTGVSGGQAVRQPRPRVSAVQRAPDRARGSATAE